MTAWRERERQFGVSLLNPTGRLQLAPDWTPSLKATQTTLRTLDVPFETLTDGELRKRYPQMNPDGLGVGLLEPGAMVIRAKQAMLAVSQAFVRAGGTLRVARVQPGTVTGGRLVDLQVADGSRLGADAFVFACGPWLPKLFPGLLGSRIQVPGRDVLYFGLPAGDQRLAFPNFPNFSEERYYGFASIDGRGFKVCPTSGTTSFDPDVDERIISAFPLTQSVDGKTEGKSTVQPLFSTSADSFASKNINGTITGKGVKYNQYDGLCLETHAWVNAINVPAWKDSVILKPGQTYAQHMVHTFTTE